MENKNTEWTDEEINFLLEHHELTIAEMSIRLGRTKSSIQNKRTRLGFKNNNKYTLDRNFFKKPVNEKSAYWLGFLYADGYISQGSRTWCIGISLKESDIEHLKKFNKDIGGNYPIKVRGRVATFGRNDYKKEFRQCEIRIYNQELGKDLINLGITEKKSKNMEFPLLNKESLVPFIRGYFDGDGSIFIKNKSLCCNFTSGSKGFLEKLSDILNEYKIKHYIVSFENPSTYYQVVISKKEDVKKFLNLIYDNPTIYLDRKYKMYIKNKHLLKLPQ